MFDDTKVDVYIRSVGKDSAEGILRFNRSDISVTDVKTIETGNEFYNKVSQIPDKEDQKKIFKLIEYDYDDPELNEEVQKLYDCFRSMIKSILYNKIKEREELIKRELERLSKKHPGIFD